MIKKAKKSDLAKYLGVTQQAVGQYNKKKLHLMLIGLKTEQEKTKFLLANK